MKKTTLLFLLFPFVLFAQKKARITGVVLNKNNQPIENVSVSFKTTQGDVGVSSASDGSYTLSFPLRKTVLVTFQHLSYQSVQKKFTARGEKTIRFSPILSLKNEQLSEVAIKNKRKEARGITNIASEKVKNLAGANAGVENVLMTLPGVNNNNELSTQYNVRGGNFDENLVYVNGIEIYRPFLVRSGQQEGLSFANTQMLQNINFSAGGFQAKYGDKLSSVLDITYRKPTKFATQVNLSLLGGSATIEGTLLNKKLRVLTGIRYRNNSLFVNSKQIETNFHPTFTDIQSFISYQATKKLQLHFLGNFSLNNYQYTPVSRKTRFGTLADPLELIVYYSGQEQDKYLTALGALSADYQATKELKITGTATVFNTQEEEHFDIAASYNLGEVDTNAGSESFGEVAYSEGIGSQLNHARNDLDALIANVQLKATLQKGNTEWQAGLKYQKENIKDRIREWEMIDSLGFSVRPPHHNSNQEPYEPYTGPIVPFQSIRSTNNVSTNRLSGYLQFSKKTTWKQHQVWLNLGLRGQAWEIKTESTNSAVQHVFSPRGQFAIKPNWEKDVLFRIAAGMYYQPPFYKELKDATGAINPAVKAQKSVHIVAGSDFSFLLWDRPFKLTTEIYYKHLTDVNPYTVDNVRIRYQATNNAKAYATGIDIRLNGEFVPGNESWISIGYLKTEENTDDKGYIARPSDQRLKVGVLFQDYVPNLPNLKAYLNLVYNTGVPGGAPSYTDPYIFQSRLGAYKRADLGLSYVLSKNNKQAKKRGLQAYKEATIGIELFNIFDIRNAITNTWVRDVYSKQQYGIPNYMTGRVLNIKLAAKF